MRIDYVDCTVSSARWIPYETAVGLPKTDQNPGSQILKLNTRQAQLTPKSVRHAKVLELDQSRKALYTSIDPKF